MPSNPVAILSQPSSSHRRSTASSRPRDNRSQTPVSGPSRRRRSRTPDARMSDETVLFPRSGDAGPPGPLRRKKKSSSALSTHSSNTRPARDSAASDETSVGKPRPRHRQSGQTATEADSQRAPDSRQPAKHKRTEESRSRDPLRGMTSRAFSEASGDEGRDEDVVMYSPDDIARLKKEVEDLKRVSINVSSSAQPTDNSPVISKFITPRRERVSKIRSVLARGIYRWYSPFFRSSTSCERNFQTHIRCGMTLCAKWMETLITCSRWHPNSCPKLLHCNRIQRKQKM